MTLGINPGTIGIWPQITQHDVEIDDVCLDGDYFVGWWGSWVSAVNGWYVAADENGIGGGIPRTNIAPAIGYPTGWNHPNLAFPACVDLGVGTYEIECGGVVPAQEGTWGAIKALYD